MGSKLRKNAVITAYINSFCLVCECSFDSVKETVDHIKEDSHTNNLLKHPYLEKYGYNHIRKVNKGYFCEFCGLLLPTAAKVSLHIQEKAHYDNKGTFLLRRPSGPSSVIAFDDVLISERAWHSLTEDTCAICNEEFSNANIHKTESAHLLKLVQNKVEFGADNSIYRKTDDSSFQCLTCNSVFALDTLNEHFTDPEHKKLYTKCQEEMKKYTEQNKTTNNTEETAKPVVKKNDDAKKVDKNHNNINEESQKQNAAKTNEQQNNIAEKSQKQATAKTNETQNNIVAKSQVPAKTSDCECKEIIAKNSSAKSVTEDEATTYANANNLTYNAGNTNAFCRVCETKLPATLRSMKEHVNGKEHKNKLAKATQISLAAKAKPSMTKRSMSKFIQSAAHVENLFHQDVIINEKYCVPLASFVMITKNGSKYRCQTCEVNMYEDDIGEHTDSSRHQRAMQDTCIINSLPDSEFVREVRPGIFHCGFCNLIVPRWEEVGSHLQAREHKENKDACGWRLQRHMPALVERRRQEEMEVFRMFLMGHVFRH